MHIVGPRALHSVAAAPRQTSRCRTARHRQPLGTVRGFLGSAARSARPDESNATLDDDLRPVTPANSDTGRTESNTPGPGAGGVASSTPDTTSTSGPTATSSSPNPTPVPTSPPAPTPPTPPVPIIAATAEPPLENVKDTTSAPVGRGRSSRHRNQAAMPAITLPEWFLKERVRLHNPCPPSSPTTLRADLAAASSLMFPKSSLGASLAAVAGPIDVAALTLQEREELQQYFGAWLNGAAWDARKVAQAVARLRSGDVDAIARRGAAIAAAASYMTATLAHDSPETTVSRAPDEAGAAREQGTRASVPTIHMGKLDPENALDIHGRLFKQSARDEIKQSLKKGSLYFLEREADEAITKGFHMGSSGDSAESLVSRELYSTLATEFRAVSPAKPPKDLKRPVSVLTIMNYKGRSKAVSVIDEVANALSAHVVHMDAGSIASVVGPYLGQTAYWARGNISLLGYSVAQTNGQMALRYSSNNSNAEEDDDETEASGILSRIPVAFLKASGLSSARLSMKSFPSEMDDRWDDLKISNVLEEMIRAADGPSSTSRVKTPRIAKATTTATSAATDTSEPPHKLILHIHHFIELSTLPEGAQLLAKLRSIVDRLWQRGRKIVLVGSTSAHMAALPTLLEKAEELRQEDCHIIPYRVAEGPATRALEARDVFDANMANIRAMLSALTATPLNSHHGDFAWTSNMSGGNSDNDSAAAAELQAALSSTLYDIHWVYRFAAQVLGAGGSGSTGNHAKHNALPLDEHAFVQALRSVQDQDQMWKETTGAQEPYFSPLAKMQKSSSSSRFSRGLPGEDGDDSNGTGASGESSTTAPREIRVNGVLKTIRPSDYNEYEKKFLTDLIDARAIKTTFDDIVTPADTKESLQALTSLSLVRPEAFLYGVLAAERIPGCLLYGPPGTGKTLLAKAVAKQSGANMLEVSAASINDMWVGNSEKNVAALFSLARKLAPMVLFLDEADALLGARQTRPGRGGHRETINQFLREWDGVAPDSKAFIMVATNRPFDLDEAVLRRLPRRILVDLPLRDARLAILRVLLKDEVLDISGDDPVSLDRLATDTELYSGSDLKNLCVAAAMEAVREEVRAQAAHTGPDPFVFPARRVLAGRHFARAVQEIGASISEDMASLQAIRKFDERYGDGHSRARRQRRRLRGGVGFEVALPAGLPSEEARVRQTG